MKAGLVASRHGESHGAKREGNDIDNLMTGKTNDNAGWKERVGEREHSKTKNLSPTNLARVDGEEPSTLAIKRKGITVGSERIPSISSIPRLAQRVFPRKNEGDTCCGPRRGWGFEVGA